MRVNIVWPAATGWHWCGRCRCCCVFLLLLLKDIRYFVSGEWITLDQDCMLCVHRCVFFLLLSFCCAVCVFSKAQGQHKCPNPMLCIAHPFIFFSIVLFFMIKKTICSKEIASEILLKIMQISGRIKKKEKTGKIADVLPCDASDPIRCAYFFLSLFLCLYLCHSLSPSLSFARYLSHLSAVFPSHSYPMRRSTEHTFIRIIFISFACVFVRNYFMLFSNPFNSLMFAFFGYLIFMFEIMCMLLPASTSRVNWDHESERNWSFVNVIFHSKRTTLSIVLALSRYFAWFSFLRVCLLFIFLFSILSRAIFFPQLMFRVCG